MNQDRLHSSDVAASMIDGGTGIVPLFRAQARAEPDRLFARFNDVPLSLRKLDLASDALAAALRRRGIGRGDRVAVMLHNGIPAIAAIFALAKAGAVWVPINVQLRGEGLRFILGHAEPALLIVAENLLPVVAECGAEKTVPMLVSRGAPAPDTLEALLEGDEAFAEPAPGPDDPLAISYTSGTTGRPKGVLVTHRMLRLAAEAVAVSADMRDGDVLFHWEPLYHIGGSQMLVVPLLRRASLVMVERFSAGAFWQDVTDCGATHIHYLGGILQILLKRPADPGDRAHRVRIAWGGGAPADIWPAFQDRFGVALRECYGMTEACSITTYNDEGVVGAVGRPLPWFDVTVADEAGRPVSGDTRGEILVRAKVPGAIFTGYFRNPEATAKALREGVLHTGDVGSWMPGGMLRFHGRMTDSMRCRGENVSAWEVEHVVAAHPAVADCAVIGVAAEIGEQDIKLFVQPKPDTRFDPVELGDWLARRLAPYQTPRYIAVVDGFERTPSQRIMKHRLPTDVEGCWDRLAPSPARKVAS